MRHYLIFGGALVAQKRLRHHHRAPTPWGGGAAHRHYPQWRWRTDGAMAHRWQTNPPASRRGWKPDAAPLTTTSLAPSDLLYQAFMQMPTAARPSAAAMRIIEAADRRDEREIAPLRSVGVEQCSRARISEYSRCNPEGEDDAEINLPRNAIALHRDRRLFVARNFARDN